MILIKGLILKLNSELLRVDRSIMDPHWANKTTNNKKWEFFTRSNKKKQQYREKSIYIQETAKSWASTYRFAITTRVEHTYDNTG